MSFLIFIIAGAVILSIVNLRKYFDAPENSNEQDKYQWLSMMWFFIALLATAVI